jgi:alpha-L-fucosidase
MTTGDWFDGAGLGMFVHWDHASQQGLEVSWPLVGGIFALPKSQIVSPEQYHSSAATFDPTEWDAKALARLAADAGMRYAVLTTKHHSGYAMWPTRTMDWSVASSPCTRDLVGEFAEAMRAEGLRVGFYFSLSDWHNPDYPAFTDDHRPYVMGSSPPVPPQEQWDRFVDTMFEQIRELLTDYGTIDLIWFDGGWERSPKLWRARELEQLIRSLQPDILINDRLPGVADYSTPEQFVPATPPGGRWETCMTMNHSWGFNPDDTGYKTTRDLVHTVCEVTSKGGNLLLNVSPTGTGALPPEQLERLDGIAAWMARNGEAVHDVSPGFEPWQFYGPSTRRGDRTYLLCLMRPYDVVSVRGVPFKRVRAVSELASGTALKFSSRVGVIASLSSDPIGELRIKVPEELIDPVATVIAVDIDDPA